MEFYLISAVSFLLSAKCFLDYFIIKEKNKEIELIRKWMNEQVRINKQIADWINSQ